MKLDERASELGLCLQQFRPEARTAFLLSLAIGLLGFTSTVYMLQVYDRVVNSRSLTTLFMLTVVTLGAYAVMDLLEKYRNRLLWSAGVRFEAKLSSRVYEAMFEVMIRRTSAVQLTVLNDLKTVRDFFPNPAVGAVLELPVALVSMALIFAINPLLGWAAIVGAIAQTTVAWLLQKTSRKPLMEAQRLSQEAQQFAEASLRNSQVMESMGMLEGVLARWKSRQHAFLVFQAQASEAAGGLNALSKLLQQLMGSVLLGLSAWLLLHNQLNGGAGMMIISSVLGGRMLAPITQIVQQWSALLTVSTSWARLQALLADVPAREAAMTLPAPSGAVSVEGVSAVAPGQQSPVLRGVQFQLMPGQVLAVVGPSASGKTSLARILTGVWSPQVGKVRLDGADLHAWDKRELGPYLGYLPQGVELLDGSIAENICRFGSLDLQQVEDVARLVDLHDFILSLPEGYNTQIGRDGLMLSGGQRQRVALARALYGNPVFVVLDEPNSSLDEAGERALQNAVVAMKKRGTTFVINTHRTGLLAVADLMLVLQEGVVQIMGPVTEVLAKIQAAQAQTQVQTQVQAQPA